MDDVIVQAAFLPSWKMYIHTYISNKIDQSSTIHALISHYRKCAGSFEVLMGVEQSAPTTPKSRVCSMGQARSPQSRVFFYPFEHRRHQLYRFVKESLSV